MPKARPFRQALQPLALSPVSLAVLTALSTPARAEPVLHVDPRLLLVAQAAPAAVQAPGAKPPTVLEADVIEGRNEVEVKARGKVRMERGNVQLDADNLKLDQVTNDAQAEGQVELRREGNLIRGPRAKLNLDTFEGSFETPSYIVKPPARRGMPDDVVGSGEAEELRFEGHNHYRLFNATYSTCPAPTPDWYLRMPNLGLDFDRDLGEGYNGTLVFKGVPIAYLPWAEFPLSGGRQSGFLPPTLGTSTNTGVDVSVPYYFNLAPNYDATFAPRWMGRRGLQLNGEFRYITPSISNGRLQAEWMPRDDLTQESRSLASWSHTQDFGRGWSGFVNASEVSDLDYFADLSTRIALTSLSSLNQQVGLNYNSGTWLSAGVNVQRFQVITGATPYSRLPQVTARVLQPDVGGFSFLMPADFTSFRHPTDDEGTRSVVYPQLSLPLEQPGYFVVPKVGAHLSYYNVDRRSTSSATTTAISRTVPMASVDAGLRFERDTTWGQTDYIQTLEPRLYYLRTAYRDQSDIPVFDTARADYNFAQLYADNVYSGYDRIADANQLTVGVASRFVESATGIEWLRLNLGQRFYFEDQRVTLPGEVPREGAVADWLAGVTGRIHPKFYVDTLLQYDPREDQSERATFAMRYQPGHAQALAVSWRYKRDEFRDLDIAGQWPILGGWYGVARYNRSLRDHRVNEGLVGLEYKADCWVFRTVYHKIINTKQEYNSAIFLQIEFTGLAAIGSNPVELLRRSVSGYGKINDTSVQDPVFGAR
ncbi:LPS-assembly protein LptD [Uliginosibacterium sp. H1]|uniref:LPS-assembly protein LptD n=1 Tax=Uliginosibacterium sp. H1 TaxID=3114757 RepID=UPI002E19570E|nr:LPS-assembly protein LptD [Uliginosibacterium sp. H1]